MGPAGIEAGAWVLQQMNPPRLGRVTAVDPDGVEVAFPEGTFRWPTMPRSAHVVTEGSLAWRSVADRDALVAEYARDPLGVVVRILAESSRALVAENIHQRLVELRLVAVDVKSPVWKDQWKTLQRGLRARADVGRGPTEGTYLHLDVPATASPGTTRAAARPTTGATARVRREPVDPDRLLARVAAASTSASDRDDAVAELRRLATAGSLSDRQRAGAMALRVVAPQPIDWSAIDPRGPVPEGVLAPLVHLATAQGAWTWLAAATLGASLPSVLEACDAGWARAGTAARDVVAAVLERAAGAADASAAIGAPGLRILLAAAGDDPAAIVAALALLTRPGTDAAVADAVVEALGAVPVEPLAAVLAAADPASVGRALALAARAPIVDEGRRRLLRAAALADAPAVAEPAAWEGLDLASVVALAADPAVALVFAAGDAVTDLVRAVLVAGIHEGGIAALAEIARLDPAVVDAVGPAALAGAVRVVAARSAALGRVVAALASGPALPES